MIKGLKILAAACSATLATGIVWCLGSTMFFPWTEIDVSRGRRIFRHRCASCHAIDSGAAATFGPNLAKIGQSAADRIASLSAEQFILQSITEPNAYRIRGSTGEMPSDVAVDLSPEQILSIVGYLQTLGSEPDAEKLVELLPTDFSPQPELTAQLNFSKSQYGKWLFYTKGQCNSCHSLRGLPGNALASPDLLQAGIHSQEYLRQAIVSPNHQISPGYGLTRVALSSGKLVVGRLIAETDSNLELLVASANHMSLQTISRDDIATEDVETPIAKLSRSAMPDRYGETLSSTEVDALVYFLKTLPR